MLLRDAQLVILLNIRIVLLLLLLLLLVLIALISSLIWSRIAGIGLSWCVRLLILLAIVLIWVGTIHKSFVVVWKFYVR